MREDRLLFHSIKKHIKSTAVCVSIFKVSSPLSVFNKTFHHGSSHGSGKTTALRLGLLSPEAKIMAESYIL